MLFCIGKTYSYLCIAFDSVKSRTRDNNLEMIQYNIGSIPITCTHTQMLIILSKKKL